LISDITTPRWRGFALGMAYFPFLITPWVSAIIVGKVVGEGDIGTHFSVSLPAPMFLKSNFMRARKTIKYFKTYPLTFSVIQVGDGVLECSRSVSGCCVLRVGFLLTNLSVMPFGSSFIIGALLYYQGKAKKMGVLKSQKMTIYEFFSQIDLGGIIFFVVGFACFLLPFTIAASESKGW
jgi:hypothetical protein